MLSQTWRRLKNTPFLSRIIVFAYYILQRNKLLLCGKNNIVDIKIEGLLPRLKNVSFNIAGSHNSILISSGVHLSNTVIRIDGSNNQLLIDEDCRIAGGCLWLKDENCKLTIGKNTTIEHATIGVAESQSSLTIGADCMIAHDVDIRCSDSHSIIDINTNQRINYARDIIIEDHVWIAKSTQILKGVRIDKNSIIASGSVVTKHVPSNCIVAGVPAQVKRTGVTWLRENLPKEDTCDLCHCLHS